MSEKQAQYALINQQVKALISGESDTIANMANISSVLFNHLSDINWAGFYLYKDEQLVLGPFHGQPACIRIPMGKGVCGTSAQSRQIQVIEDVHAFEGHIACDAASNSEIVLPIVKNEVLIGVLDIDSPSIARFDQHDAEGLALLVENLVEQIQI